MPQNLLVNENNDIEELIYEIRGKYVMIDRDIAKLYKCSNGTKKINQAVKRNPEKFPEDFCFQMNNEEYYKWRSQFVTSKSDKMGLRRPPIVFTEEGVAMLATIIHTKVAASISVKIMRSFVKMRSIIKNSLGYLNEIDLIEKRLIIHDNKIDDIDSSVKMLQETFEKLDEKNFKNEIYLNGQIYDAYSRMIDILSSAKKEIIIIDNYADKNLLDVIKELKTQIVIITKYDNLLKNNIIEKYNKQYNNLKVYYNNTFHDRFVVID